VGKGEAIGERSPTFLAEFFVPMATVAKTLAALKKLVKEHNLQEHFSSIEVRSMAKDDNWLSQAFGPQSSTSTGKAIQPSRRILKK